MHFLYNSPISKGNTQFGDIQRVWPKEMELANGRGKRPRRETRGCQGLPETNLGQDGIGEYLEESEKKKGKGGSF